MKEVEKDRFCSILGITPDHPGAEEEDWIQEEEVSWQQLLKSYRKAGEHWSNS